MAQCPPKYALGYGLPHKSFSTSQELLKNSLEVDFSEHFPVANLSSMYRSVDWLQSKLKKQNYCKLSVVYLNVRSLPKNKNFLKIKNRRADTSPILKHGCYSNNRN